MGTEREDRVMVERKRVCATYQVMEARKIKRGRGERNSKHVPIITSYTLHPTNTSRLVTGSIECIKY